MIPENIFWAALARSSTIHDLRSYDHGPGHWQRVAQNGIELANYTEGADVEVVTFFALFHDTMRQNEWSDPEHGKRGFELAQALGVEALLTPAQRHKFGPLGVEALLTPAQRHKFGLAVVRHDFGEVESDPTIGCCWDADRLDLPRVGIVPDERLMSTEAGKSAARRLERELLGERR